MFEGQFTPLTLASGSVGCYCLVDDEAPLLVLAHGAGAPHDHAHMTAIASALAEAGIGTLRFNLPFMQAGKRRVDDVVTSTRAIREAVNAAYDLAPQAPILLGGHSFGGRMATHLLADTSDSTNDTMAEIIDAMVLFSFPLHASKKPAVSRAAHLHRIRQPLLFLSGTRDSLAEPQLLQKVTDELSGATLHWLDTADHGFKILKRTRQSTQDVYSEAARITASWVGSLG